ncbi:hypothetical protein Nepgr_014358 [Nepenthes gracilis]|uniref:Nonsense-mediated mRNA decay factor SMG8 n=1 Tax=Nepenthes gracilis TaxID=150966 RepID=A0AAD3SJW7_NEPGR|nr:hypothetical protein Nepgr_014358 [Nepenthes gracilis]
MDSQPNSSSSRRVLLRPPSSTKSPTSTPSLSPFPSPPPPPPNPPDPSHPSSQYSFSSVSPPAQPSSNGVVVVGFIGRRHSDVSQLINRIIDSNVFGSGNRDKVLSLEGEEVGDEAKDWFKTRKISYYHDDEKGIVYMQMCSSKCPAMNCVLESNCSLDSAVEESEFGDLRGMLFMFTVCHVILYIQEGSHFHIEVLKNLRVLQSAKHALTPLMRSQNTVTSLSRTASSPLRKSTSATLPTKIPPGRGGSIPNRNSSAISNMSGIGLYTSLFPGQCTPVTLFVFIDDFSDMMCSTASSDESTDASSNQSSALSSLGRSSLPVRGSGSVVVLARPVNKSEGGFRKKLQSSLESQIRFLIKRCRILSGSEISRAGSRNGTVSALLPLLTLDASRAVVLLDSFANQRGEPLDFVTSLVEDVLNGKATSDSLLLESHSQNGNKEDIGSLKEFIFRQTDVLRGKGGLVTNATGGSAAGVGMVAVAAAAAAASASSRRIMSTPELPNLQIWLSSSQYILKGLLSAQRGCVDEIEISRRKSRQRNVAPPQIEGAASKGADPIDVTVSLLESGKGLNARFSTLWCQRSLPAALEVYLKDLPDYYPTSQHEAHLEKALRAFHSMVRGTSVQQFMKMLEDECTSIWKSGRQLCDAISLTGQQCMHPRHDVEKDGLPSNVEGKPHSSGFVFLHACACGRSRRLRADPFDFETANIAFNFFPDCDKLIPALKLPKVSDSGSIEPISWHIVRVGSARYYEPSIGLLQSGFFVNQKFLMKWTIVLEKDKIPNVSYADSVRLGFLNSTSSDTHFESSADVNTDKGITISVLPGEVEATVESQRDSVQYFKSVDKKISFGRGLPNITMKKPFSEVVAGSASSDSAFPPLQAKKHPLVGSGKGLKKNAVKDGNVELSEVASGHQISEKTEEIPSTGENFNGLSSGSSSFDNPFLQIGSNVVPLNVNDVGKARVNLSWERTVVYVGFEHECPRGHRFILSLDLLTELGSPFSSPDETLAYSSVKTVDHKHRDPSKLANTSSYNTVHLPSNSTTAAMNKGRNLEKSGEMGTTEDPSVYGPLHLSEAGKEHYQASVDASMKFSSFKDRQASLKSVNLDDRGHAFSLLNRNLPIYMNCPHCKVSKNKKDRQKTKFAGMISQLQRIFVVTPPLPIVLATNPVVQFEASCQPPNISNLGQQLQFSLGCQVVLPPDSFVSVRLPFIYGVQVENKALYPLHPFEQQPEMTAWIKRGTTLQVMSKGSMSPCLDGEQITSAILRTDFMTEADNWNPPRPQPLYSFSSWWVLSKLMDVQQVAMTFHRSHLL